MEERTDSPPPPAGKSGALKRALFGATMLLSFAVLGWQCLRFSTYAQDDAYISFAYGKNLAEHGRLVYRLDEAVEGYTNFLWTALSAGAYAAVGKSSVLSAMRALSACAAAGLLGVVAIANRARSRAWVTLAAPLSLASVTALAMHVNSGLETVLFALSITAGFALLRSAIRAGSPPWPGLLCFLAAALTRFDGFVPLGAALLAAWLSFRKGDRRHLRAVIAVGGLYVIYFLWRAWYYDSLWPNTVTAKLSTDHSTKVRLEAGLTYLTQGIESLGLYWLLPGCALWAWRSRRDWGELLGTALIGWFAFQSVSVGGDAMLGFRFLFPAVPIALIQGLAGYDERLRALPRGAGTWLSIAAAAGFIAWAQWVFPLTQVGVWQVSVARRAGFTIDGFRRVAQAFSSVCRPEDELATDVAGVFAYFTDCRILDMWGLASREVARRGRAPDPRAFTTYGVVAPEVALERSVRFLLPFPPIPSARRMSREKAIASIFPDQFFKGRPEMAAYTLKELSIAPWSYAYFDRQ